MSILQKIVEEMYVEPELLAQLNEEQKQILFCKMREEQIRKFNEWDKKMESQELPHQHPGKRVQFLLGRDGEPWTWVMDADRQGDLSPSSGAPPSGAPSYDQMAVEREAATKRLMEEEEKLKEQLRRELLDSDPETDRSATDATSVMSKGGDSEADRPSAAAELLHKIKSINPSAGDQNKSQYTYGGDVAFPVTQSQGFTSATADAQLKMQRDIAEQREREESHMNERKPPQSSPASSVSEVASQQKPVYSSTSGAAPFSVAQSAVRITQAPAPAPQRLGSGPGQSSNEPQKNGLAPPRNLHSKQPSPPPPEPESTSDLDEAAQERIWQEQERKAKEREREIREIARRARAQHKSNSLREASITELADQFSRQNLFHSLRPARPLRPPNRQSVIDWFRAEERSAGTGLDPVTRKAAPWFHGIIARTEAERLLSGCAEGTFLVRVSERIWGFAISVRSVEKVKHYLVERVPEGYQLMGTNMLVHKSLWELISYHKSIPLKEEDYLRTPLGQRSKPADYTELLPPSIYEC